MTRSARAAALLAAVLLTLVGGTLLLVRDGADARTPTGAAPSGLDPVREPVRAESADRPAAPRHEFGPRSETADRTKSPPAAEPVRVALPEVVARREAADVPPPAAVLAAIVLAGDPSAVVVGPLPAERATDGLVHVRLPAGATALRWWVRTGQQWLAVDAEQPPGAAPESVWGDRVLVRVLDAAGAPGVGIGVAVWTADGASRTESTAQPTDRFGVALLPRPARGGRRGARELPADAHSIKVALPFVPPVTAPLPPDGPGPVVLRLPPTAAVEVRARSAEPLPPDLVVALHPRVEGSHATGFANALTARIDADGVARFPRVGPGLAFDATLSGAPDRVSTRTRLDGETRAGATLTGTIDAGGLRPAFTGRVLRAEGGPAPRVAVHVSVDRRSAGSPWNGSTFGSAATDAEGRFRSALDLDGRDLEGATLSASIGEVVVLRRRCTAVAPGGAVDLGDLVEGRTAEGVALPVFAAGTLSDGDGAAVPGVLVQAWRRRGEAWRFAADLRAATADDGSFEIRGAPEEADAWEMRVAYDPRARTADPVRFEPGETRIRLVARETGTVTLRVIAPARLPASSWPEVVIEGQPAAGLDTTGLGVHGMMMFTSTIQFTGLGPGDGRIVVRERGNPSRILKTIGVRVDAGRTTDAGTLDLAAIVPLVTVRVLGADGKPAADGAVWWRPSKAERHALWTGIPCASDGTAVLPATSAVDVLARRTGSGYAEALSVTTDATLSPPAARDAVAVTATLAEGIDVPEAPFRLTATLSRIDGSGPLAAFGDASDPRNAGRSPVEFDRTTRRARFEVAEPGTYSATLTLWLDRVGSGSGQGFAPETPATVVVGEGREPREVVVRVTEEELAARRRALESR